MKIGVLGLIMSDLTDVDDNKIRWVAELGFHGVGAHLTVPADTVLMTPWPRSNRSLPIRPN